LTRRFDQYLISGDLQDMFVKEQYIIRYTQEELYNNLNDFSLNGNVITSTSNDPWIFVDTSALKPFKYIRIDIDLLSARRMEAQFFYIPVSEEGFSEYYSVKKTLRNGINHIRIIPLQEYSALRLDLTERNNVSLSVQSVIVYFGIYYYLNFLI
jgi:hypothetical protein